MLQAATIWWTLVTHWSLDTWALSKNTRYHLDYFRGVPIETMSRQEKFNLTHSRLRNIVERTFGVLKNRWQILDGIPYCHLTKQKMIIIFCFALHNYLFSREHGLGSSTYPPSPWVQLNASNSMSVVREFISLGLWGQWLWRGDVPIDGWVSSFCMGTAFMLTLMCLEKGTNFV